MWQNRSSPAGEAGPQRDDKIFGYGNRQYTTPDCRLSNPQKRRARLNELDTLMAQDDENWIDYWDEWLELWPHCFADAMGAAL